MKTVIVLSVLLLAVSSKLLNMGTWKANPNNLFANMTLEEQKSYLGAKIAPFGATNAPLVEIQSLQDLPANFDARQQWPTCIHPIRDQGQCGSCWAFGATEAFSDRACIATNGAVNTVFSPENLVSCDYNNYGCGGGYLDVAWNYIATNGIVTESCFPYSAGSGYAPPCQSTCSDGTAWTVYKATNVRSLSAAGGKQTIFDQGPIETAFYVYQDFFYYTSGVYVQTSSAYAGAHAVKVLGWGHDDASGLDYWLAANSWGVSWGENGFFKIAFGQVGFDSNFITGDYAGGQTSDLFLQ